mmetsp:Transcript_30013/g.77756  ORF Transcript_30013/g.77756 Transcript_30013/m.77756 type:complete len:312 (-) Transcript_30013:68-1003(-)
MPARSGVTTVCWLGAQPPASYFAVHRHHVSECQAVESDGCGQEPQQRERPSESLTQEMQCRSLVLRRVVLLDLLDACLVRQNGRELLRRHGAREEPEEDGLEEEQGHQQEAATSFCAAAVPMPVPAMVAARLSQCGICREEGTAEQKPECIHREKAGVEAEEDKVLLVVRPDAVIDPRAVMIHLHHAAIALRAVVCSRRFVAVALGAHRRVAALLVLQQRARLVLDRHGARVSGHGPRVRRHRQDRYAHEAALYHVAVGRLPEPRREYRMHDDVVSKAQQGVGDDHAAHPTRIIMHAPPLPTCHCRPRATR